MSKPATLYPRPEPVKINPRVIVFGSAVVSILFFIIGWTFQTIGVFA